MQPVRVPGFLSALPHLHPDPDHHASAHLVSSTRKTAPFSLAFGPNLASSLKPCEPVSKVTLTSLIPKPSYLEATSQTLSL